MKYANKLMVVPYVPRLESNPQEAQILDIDKEMGSILHDQTKNTDQKVKLYNQALVKFNDNLNRYKLVNEERQDQSSQVFSDLITSKVYEKIQPDLEIIKQIPGTMMIQKNIKIEPFKKEKRPLVKPKVFIKEVKKEEDLMTEDEENLNATNDELHTTTNPTTSKDLRDPPQLEKINRTRNVVVDYSKKNYLTTDDNLYIYPEFGFEKRFEDMKKKFPQGFDVVSFKNYLTTNEARKIFNDAAALSETPNVKTRKVNEAFIIMAEKFALKQEGKGIKKWTFKNFF